MMVAIMVMMMMMMVTMVTIVTRHFFILFYLFRKKIYLERSRKMPLINKIQTIPL
jgi:hypothetical protein